jgi:hypothetical protein
MSRLHQPIIEGREHVGFLRSCRKCGRWFAMKHVRSEPHKAIGEIKFFKCRHCGNEFVDVPELPPTMLK